MFKEIAQAQRGFGHLFLFLLVEWAVRDTAPIATAVARLGFDARGGLVSLFAGYRNAALAPALAVYFAGLLVYYRLRRTPRRLEAWAAASVLAYAWVPHTLLVAAGVALEQLGFDHVLLPQHPLESAQGQLVAIKLAIAFGPSLVYAGIAVRALGESAPDSRPVRRSWPLLATMALLVAGALTLQLQSVATHWESLRPVTPSDPLPSFSVRSITDAETWTPRALQHPVTLIDFWATWCPPCVAALPHLAQLHEELAPKGLQTISINTEPENLETVRTFVRERALPFPVYVDNGSAQLKLKVESLPTLFVVDGAGTLQHVHTGSVSIQTLRNEVLELLAAAQ